MAMSDWECVSKLPMLIIYQPLIKTNWHIDKKFHFASAIMRFSLYDRVVSLFHTNFNYIEEKKNSMKEH